MKNYNKQIGIELKKARINKGYTLRQVADIIGKDHTTIVKWEGGKTSILATDLIAYLDILGVSLDEFVNKFKPS